MMDVTVSQAIVLKKMFEFWNTCGSTGMSRTVGFMVDGDGDFDPKCIITTNKQLPELKEPMKINEDADPIDFDYDILNGHIRRWEEEDGRNPFKE